MRVKRGRGRAVWSRTLPRNPLPTNQRAEICAIIMALELALKEEKTLANNPYIITRTSSDSKYAIGCMNEWIHKWRQNGWINAAGNPIANQHLIKKAYSLNQEVGMMGEVEYVWISRECNEMADRYCNDELDNNSIYDSD